MKRILIGIAKANLYMGWLILFLLIWKGFNFSEITHAEVAIVLSVGSIVSHYVDKEQKQI